MNAKKSSSRRPRLTPEQKAHCRAWLIAHPEQVESMTIAELAIQFEQDLDMYPESIAHSAVRSLLEDTKDERFAGEDEGEQEESKPLPKKATTPMKKAVVEPESNRNGLPDIRKFVTQICEETVSAKLKELFQ